MATCASLLRADKNTAHGSYWAYIALITIYSITMELELAQLLLVKRHRKPLKGDIVLQCIGINGKQRWKENHWDYSNISWAQHICQWRWCLIITNDAMHRKWCLIIANDAMHRKYCLIITNDVLSSQMIANSGVSLQMMNYHRKWWYFIASDAWPSLIITYIIVNC